jgi:signal peptidase I
MGKFVFDEFSYEYWLDKYIQFSKEKGEPLKYEELSLYGLPCTKWYLAHCSNPGVKDFNSFIEYEANMIPRYCVSKEKAIQLIFDLQKQLNRAIMKKDLIGIKNGGIGEGVIKKYWGSFTNMKKQLGLEIIGQNLTDANRSIFTIKRDVVKLCAYILKHENRFLINRNDWDKVKNIASYQSCRRWFVMNGSTLRDFIESIGFNFNKSGDGINYCFQNDKEITRSQFEFEFSNFLRSIGLKFDIDYFRDIKYSNFIKTERSYLNCDYVINYNNRVIYIEIAGMLRDYKSWYLEDKSLNSKSKENYRLTLKKKQQMLKENNLEYYILFPEDLEEDFLCSIFGIEIRRKEVV